MDNLLRLLLRFVLVPFGYVAAVMAGTLVILFGSWKLGQAIAVNNAEGQAFAVFGFAFAAPILLFTLLVFMWVPGAIGILLSEAFAIRSWMFHAGNGALSAWVGGSWFGYVDNTRVPLNEPMAVIAAGLAAGFAYWLVAGWSAGFWKPVFVGPAPTTGTALVRPENR